MYKVYMHRNLKDGKVYIGCTSQDLSKRFQRGYGYEKCTRFYKAIEEDGWDSFAHMVLADGMTKDEAMALEEALVDAFHATDPRHGYNMRRGGYHNTPVSEVGTRISAAKMGHEVTAETRAKLREYGRKPVLQMTRDGEPLRVFPSLTEAAEAVNAKKTNIYAVCTGKKPSCRNYRWAYYQEVV